MPLDIDAEFNREPDYATGWHAHDAVMLLAPSRGVFTIADDTGEGRAKCVPPGVFYWTAAGCGHRSRTDRSDQAHWVCYAPPDALGVAPRAGIAALSDAGRQLLALQRLLAEDDGAAESAALHRDVSELLWRECAARAASREAVPRSTSAERLVARVDAELEARLAEHPQLDMLAAVCGISRRHLTRLYRRATGHSIYARLTALRMQHAAVLLATTESTVLEAAGAVGFDNPSHFARAFRLHHGLGPSAFRRRSLDPASRTEG